MRLRWILVLTAGLISGCAPEETVFKEVKRPHELLKVSELNQFIKVVHGLPDHKLPPLPPLFAQVPDWDLNRDLSVQGLVNEEQKKNTARWQSEAVLAKLSHHRLLQQLLKKQNLSLPQFLGLAEAISLAAARTHYEDINPLQVMLRNGQLQIQEMSRREAVFSNLPEEEQYELIRQAAWIARVSRAHHLLSVPEENVLLLKQHWKSLKPFLPEEVLRDPLAEVADSQKIYGLPFEETIYGGSDSALKWSPQNPEALIGHDDKRRIPRTLETSVLKE